MLLEKVRFDPAKLKEARGETPAVDVAQAIGVLRQTYYQYEQGITRPNPDMMVRLCKYFGKPIEFFSTAE